jgi:hypothetical protein
MHFTNEVLPVASNLHFTGSRQKSTAWPLAAWENSSQENVPTTFGIAMLLFRIFAKIMN